MHLAVREYERLYRGRTGEQTGGTRGERRIISEKHFRRLRSFDERQAGDEGELLFEWRRRKLWPKQWVGVVQVGGLTVEILPKIASRTSPESSNGEEHQSFARGNLLYMLALAGEVPIRPRDVADLAVGCSSMLDILVDIFARRLLDELKRGRNRSYERRRRNRRVLKGKLQFSEHLKQNAARRDRFFVEYDEYLEDNLLNRVFKAACRTLRGAIRRPGTDEKLKQCLMLLDDVSDTRVSPPDFDWVHFNRNNRRFRESFDFCRMLYLGQAPTSTFGQVRTYSILFDMNALFERFVTEFIRRHVFDTELKDKLRMHPQSKRLRRYLLWTGPDERKGPVRMRPDILFTARNDHQAGAGDGSSAALIIDTKWKQLEAENDGSPSGISTSDLYQLYAYTQRYQANGSFLLYPRSDKGARAEDYLLPESIGQSGDSAQHVGIEILDLSGDLARSVDARRELAEDLGQLLRKWIPSFGVIPED